MPCGFAVLVRRGESLPNILPRFGKNQWVGPGRAVARRTKGLARDRPAERQSLGRPGFTAGEMAWQMLWGSGNVAEDVRQAHRQSHHH